MSLRERAESARVAPGLGPHAGEVQAGHRFKFGANWRRFLSSVTSVSIADAQASIAGLLGLERLDGRTFVDVGCGSGLFSLAARRLGATVRSFDYDPQSVACARELKARFLPDDPGWCIEPGSILDADYVRSLGTFDVVYAWGVLHHTGDLWKALTHAAWLVAPGAHLFVAVYNDQGAVSKAWRVVKKVYCANTAGRALVTAVFVPVIGGLTYGRRVLRGRTTEPAGTRGMSAYHDWIDWLGGYPFEVASADSIVALYTRSGFELAASRTTNRLGCNQLVFRKPAS